MENKRDASVEEAQIIQQKDGDEATAKRSEVRNLRSCAFLPCKSHILSQFVSFFLKA